MALEATGGLGGYRSPKKETLDFFLSRGKYKKKKTPIWDTKKEYPQYPPAPKIAPAPTPAPTPSRPTPTPSPRPTPTTSPRPTTTPSPRPSVGGGGGGGEGFSYNYPSITTPNVPDYMALAQLWLAKYPELLLPDVERAEYLARSGEEIRPMFEAQESKLRRQAGEEEVERLQDLYGRGLIGGISKEALVDVNKRLTEVLGEMGFKEESMVATRASEMEQTATQNAMSQHATRIQDWGNQYGVSETAMRNTFLDQMSKAGFEMQLADNAWQRSMSEKEFGFQKEQFGFQKEQFDWEKSFAEQEFDWQKQQAATTVPTIVNYAPTWVPDETEPTSTSTAYQEYLVKYSTVNPAFLMTSSEFHKRGRHMKGLGG